MIDTTAFVLTVAFFVVITLGLWYRGNKMTKIWERDWNSFMKRNYESNEVIDYMAETVEIQTEFLTVLQKIYHPEDLEDIDAAMEEAKEVYERFIELGLNMPEALVKHLPKTNELISTYTGNGKNQHLP
jgi:hypothetical protein